MINYMGTVIRRNYNGTIGFPAIFVNGGQGNGRGRGVGHGMGITATPGHCAVLCGGASYII